MLKNAALEVLPPLSASRILMYAPFAKVPTALSEERLVIQLAPKLLCFWAEQFFAFAEYPVDGLGGTSIKA